MSLNFEPGNQDFARLHAFQQADSFFVIRARFDFKSRRLYSRRVDRDTGLICDQIVELVVFYSQGGYSERQGRIRYRDDTGHQLVFLTNHLSLPALTVCEVYRQRWQIELFFKRVKQHLRIKRFFGTSANAVKSQIWIAVAIYVLVAIVRKRLNLSLSLSRDVTDPQRHAVRKRSRGSTAYRKCNDMHLQDPHQMNVF